MPSRANSAVALPVCARRVGDSEDGDPAPPVASMATSGLSNTDTGSERKGPKAHYDDGDMGCRVHKRTNRPRCRLATWRDGTEQNGTLGAPPEAAPPRRGNAASAVLGPPQASPG